MEFWEKNLLNAPSVTVAKYGAPSRPLNWVEIPAPAMEKSKFIYNYYTWDEDINDSGVNEAILDHMQISSGDVPAFWEYTAADGNDSGKIKVDWKDIYASVPRLISLAVKPVQFSYSATQTNYDTEENVTFETAENNESLIRTYLPELVDDTYFSGAGVNGSPYVNFYLQDNNIVYDAQALIDLGIEIIQQQNPEISDTMAKNVIVDELISGGWSWGNAIGGDKFKGVERFINQLLAAKSPPGVMGVDTDYGESITTESGFSRVFFDGMVNSKYVANVVSRMVNNAINPFADSMSQILPTAFEWQSEARQKQTGPPELGEFDILFPYQTLLSSTQSSDPMVPQSGTQWNQGSASTIWIEPIGYVFEKFEIIPLQLGGYLWIPHEPIIFGTPNSSHGIDIRVKANSQYVYRPRMVVKLKTSLLTTTPAGEVWENRTLLVTSRAGQAAMVETSQDAAMGAAAVPPPPRDLRFIWDHMGKELTVHWSFPVETQRDIKYFKIYRRASMWEPFQLLSLYNFNDKEQILGISPPNLVDAIRPSLVKLFKTRRDPYEASTAGTYEPVTMYTDSEFTVDSTYIYAIVAIDVMGNSSAYSSQYTVRFNEYMNNIDIELLSPAGAPEPYPNWAIREDVKSRIGNPQLTLDAIKASDYNDMYISLFPDAWRLHKSETGDPDSTNDDIGHLRCMDGKDYSKGRYFLTINNLDIHKTEVVEIKLKNVD